MNIAPAGEAGTGHVAILVVVGTDAHPFDRLMRWLERWYSSRSDRPRMQVQHGYTSAPDLPGAVDFVGHRELQRVMASVALVVSHGGPGAITEARRHGHLPIVVPRDPVRGEHVDNHQQLFARRLAPAGLIRLCEDEQDLAVTLDAGLSDPAAFTLTGASDGHVARAQAAARVGEIVEALVAARRGRRLGRAR